MNHTLILSGGTGSRLGGDVPKQYIKVRDKAVITYALETFLNHSEIDCICIVADPAWQDFINEEIKRIGLKTRKSVTFATPGATRQISILNGLKELANNNANPADKVIIHDAARPLVSANLISDILEELQNHEGVMPALPMKDTVYIGKGGQVHSLLDREQVLAGQAPEGFIFGKYLEACEALLPEDILAINGSTEPALLAKMDVVYIAGEEENFKITTPLDLERFKQYLSGE